MSPARRPARGGGTGRGRAGGARKRKGGGRGIGIALALLGIVAAALCAAAIYLGFVPGPASWLGRGSARTEEPSLDSAAAPAAPATPAGPVAADTLAGAPASGLAAPAIPAATTVTAADSAAGDAVYRGTGLCVGCHGATGEGVPGLGSSLRETRLGDGSLASIARIVGGGAPPSAQYRIAMPAYGGQLAADDVARVSAYVFALAHPGSVRPDSATAPGAPTIPADGAVNADAAPGAGRPPAPRPIRPSVPPPPAPAGAAGAPGRRP